MVLLPTALGLIAGFAPLNTDHDWPSWRGPDNSGAAPDANPPLTWSETENVRFKVAVPGRGHATPVILGKRLYLLSAVDTGVLPEGAEAAAEPEPQDRGRRSRGRPARPSTIQRFEVLAYDRTDGSLLWSTTVREAAPHEGTHSDGTWASSSAVLDGEHVFANFGSNGLYCLNHDGDVLWDKDLGDMTVRGTFGEGASPALHGDVLVVPWDHEGDSFITALDKNTGEERWRTERVERSHWSTPLVVEVDGRHQVVLNAATARAYDLESGDEIWNLGGMTDNVVPSAIHRDGMVFLGSGFRGAALRAVDLIGAEGDLATSAAVLWAYDRDMPYVPSMALCDQYLYALKTNSGILTVFDIDSGEVAHGPVRLDSVSNVYASPLCAGGRVYIVGRDGTSAVLEHGGEFEVLAVNELDDGCDASPVAIGDWLYLRTRSHLYGLGSPGDA